MTTIYHCYIRPIGGSLTSSLTALIKQVFSASNSLAHRSFLSSCLPVVVAATHFPYTAAWTTQKMTADKGTQRKLPFKLSYISQNKIK